MRNLANVNQRDRGQPRRHTGDRAGYVDDRQVGGDRHHHPGDRERHGRNHAGRLPSEPIHQHARQQASERQRDCHQACCNIDSLKLLRGWVYSPPHLSELLHPNSS
uniref:Uncharacterized protein n=1 Tax=Photinus pyralis TaxID=7054 RepID=A0A1Y1N3X5_PHOPY